MLHPASCCSAHRSQLGLQVGPPPSHSASPCLPTPLSCLQLVDHPFIKPSSILSHEVLESYASEYLYLGCVQFVKQVRQG